MQSSRRFAIVASLYAASTAVQLQNMNRESNRIGSSSSTRRRRARVEAEVDAEVIELALKATFESQTMVTKITNVLLMGS
jgi:hypothetical protein